MLWFGAQGGERSAPLTGPHEQAARSDGKVAAITEARISSIVIVGGGTAGWMAAAVLAKLMGPLLEIHLIESDEIGTVGVGEATIPQIKLLLRLLDVDENDFLAQTQGTFKLGIQFHDWQRTGAVYMHAFGAIGIDVGQLSFAQYWLRSRQAGARADLWAHSLNAVAARAERFARLERAGDMPLGGIAYAFHFDATLVARYLRRYSETRGVLRTEGRIVDTQLGSADGSIESLILADGTRIVGDFYVDCSGFRGVLIEQALHSGYEDWSQWLPCDRAVAVASEAVEALRPYTQATARAAGWQWRIPLQQRTGNGYVYSSRHVGDDEATATLLSQLDAPALAEPRLLRFTTGRRKQFWNRNCVALGLASGFLEPLESTSIHLVQSALARLVAMFPDRTLSPADIAAYNRQTASEYERVRDFIILHYHANERSEPFWRERRALAVPEALTIKLESFRANGRIHREPEELFTEPAWWQVMLGQGIEPAGHHPLANRLSTVQLEELLANVRAIVAQTVAALPAHRAYVAQHCAARA